MQDIYTWLVTYEDGSTTAEYSHERPDGRGFAEIEDKPIQSISLFLVADTSKEARVAMPYKEDVQPVFFRRRYLALDGTENRTTVHCIGWKREESACYLFVFDDGSSLLTEDLQAV